MTAERFMPEPEDTVARAKIALLAMQRHSWEQGTAMQAFLEQGDGGIGSGTGTCGL